MRRSGLGIYVTDAWCLNTVEVNQQWFPDAEFLCEDASCCCCIHSPNANVKAALQSVSWVCTCSEMYVYSLNNCIYALCLCSMKELQTLTNS